MTSKNTQGKRQVAIKPGVVQVEDFEAPAPGVGQVLVESIFTCISPGTELAWLHKKPNTPGEYPMYLGYSGCGRVAACGAGVEHFKVGDVVAGSLTHASHQLVDATKCHHVPKGLSHQHAAAYRLISIALQGIRKAGVQLGQDVAVVGLGPIGLMAAQLARAAGATHVEGIDTLAWRRDLAKRCDIDGVSASIQAPEHMGRYHVVIEATGVPQAVAPSLKLAKRRGAVVLLGSTRGIVEQVDFYTDVHRPGIIVIGAHDGVRAQCEDVGDLWTLHSDEATSLKLQVSGRVDVSPLISDVVKPEDAQRAYDRLLGRQEQLMTMVFDWKA